MREMREEEHSNEALSTAGGGIHQEPGSVRRNKGETAYGSVAPV